MKHADTPSVPTLSLGDIMDKLTILALKIFYGEETAYREHEYLKEGLIALGYDGDLIASVIRLAHANHMIWFLENEIRNDKEAKFTLQEIGERALKIRNHNRKRVEYKNVITKMDNIGFQETKTNHLSQ
jgi:hypothetical protein